MSQPETTPFFLDTSRFRLWPHFPRGRGAFNTPDGQVSSWPEVVRSPELEPQAEGPSGGALAPSSLPFLVPGMRKGSQPSLCSLQSRLTDRAKLLAPLGSLASGQRRTRSSRQRGGGASRPQRALGVAVLTLPAGSSGKGRSKDWNYIFQNSPREREGVAVAVAWPRASLLQKLRKRPSVSGCFPNTSERLRPPPGPSNSSELQRQTAGRLRTPLGRGRAAKISCYLAVVCDAHLTSKCQH